MSIALVSFSRLAVCNCCRECVSWPWTFHRLPFMKYWNILFKKKKKHLQALYRSLLLHKVNKRNPIYYTNHVQTCLNFLLCQDISNSSVSSTAGYIYKHIFASCVGPCGEFFPKAQHCVCLQSNYSQLTEWGLAGVTPAHRPEITRAHIQLSLSGFNQCMRCCQGFFKRLVWVWTEEE